MPVTVATVLRLRRRIPRLAIAFPRRLLVPLLTALAVTGALAIADSEKPPASIGEAAAAKARPNIVVIETDDQALESMRVMDNVNTLIGDRGVTFRNSLVNYSLCCPSRATFLTGQYAHNHRVLSNQARNGGFSRFHALHGNNNLAVWLRQAGYYTAMIGRYLNGYVFARSCRRAGRSGARPRTRSSTATRSTRTAPWSATAKNAPTSSRTC